MCSTRCDRPASAASSAAEPVAIQTPSVTDRTVGMASVTTRTPESRTVNRWSVSVLAPVGIAVARAAGAAPRSAIAATVAAAARAAVAAVAAAAARRPSAAAGRTGCHELLLRLARDLGVLREAQADATALAVDLEHADVDLVALVQHVLDGVDALARRHVGDVQQAIGALRQLDEGAERRRLDDLRGGELVADLDLLGHRRDPRGERLAERAVGRVDQHLAVVVDVDLRL